MGIMIEHEILSEVLQISKIGLHTEPDMNLLYNFFIDGFTIKPLSNPYFLMV